MRFSQCGQLLATAGQDTTLRIWVLRDSYNTFKGDTKKCNNNRPELTWIFFFSDMRTRYNADSTKSSSPTNSYDNVIADQEAIFSTEDRSSHVFNERPFCTYQGHTSDVLDICWAKVRKKKNCFQWNASRKFLFFFRQNYFILTSSMDKTVRLWHISRRECLCCFQHIDFVTALAFHPKNDQFFLSASLDGVLRLWNIPEKKLTLWNEVDGNTKLITAANFIQVNNFGCKGNRRKYISICVLCQFFWERGFVCPFSMVVDCICKSFSPFISI